MNYYGDVAYSHRDHLGARADGDGDPRLHVGVAGLADGRDVAVLDADVGLEDAGVIDQLLETLRPGAAGERPA